MRQSPVFRDHPRPLPRNAFKYYRRFVAIGKHASMKRIPLVPHRLRRTGDELSRLAVRRSWNSEQDRVLDNTNR